MPRKKISNADDAIEKAVDLDEGEQIVEQNTRTIRKEKAPAKNEPVEAEIAGEVVFDEPEPASPEISDTSIAAMIFDAEDDDFENQYCSIHIRRYPDAMNDHFISSNSANLSLPPMRNVELAAERSDIEEAVRNLHGGGHYFFQIHYNNRLTKSWKVSLSDPPEMVARTNALNVAAAIIPPATETKPVNPFDQFLETLEKQKRMKELLFGDELKELEDLRKKASENHEPAEQPSERMKLLEAALNVGNADVQGRILDSIFPNDEEGSSHWIVDLVRLGIEHRDSILPLVGALFGAVPQQPRPGNIEALMRATPPNAVQSTLEPLARSSFKRRNTISPNPGELHNEYGNSTSLETSEPEEASNEPGN